MLIKSAWEIFKTRGKWPGKKIKPTELWPPLDDVLHSSGQEGADRAQHVPGVEADRGTGHVLGLVLLVAVDQGLVQCIGENIYQTQCQGQLY